MTEGELKKRIAPLLSGFQDFGTHTTAINLIIDEAKQEYPDNTKEFWDDGSKRDRALEQWFKKWFGDSSWV